jgi:hypothetical protein
MMMMIKISNIYYFFDQLLSIYFIHSLFFTPPFRGIHLSLSLSFDLKNQLSSHGLLTLAFVTINSWYIKRKHH